MPWCLQSGLHPLLARNPQCTPLDILADAASWLLWLPFWCSGCHQLTLFYGTNLYYIMYCISTLYRTTVMVYQIRLSSPTVRPSLLLFKFISQLSMSRLHWVVPWPPGTTPSSFYFCWPAVGAANRPWTMPFLTSLTLANMGSICGPLAWLNDSVGPSINGCFTTGAVACYCTGANDCVCTLNHWTGVGVNCCQPLHGTIEFLHLWAICPNCWQL